MNQRGVMSSWVRTPTGQAHNAQRHSINGVASVCPTSYIPKAKPVHLILTVGGNEATNIVSNISQHSIQVRIVPAGKLPTVTVDGLASEYIPLPHPDQLSTAIKTSSILSI